MVRRVAVVLALVVALAPVMLGAQGSSEPVGASVRGAAAVALDEWVIVYGDTPGIQGSVENHASVTMGGVECRVSWGHADSVVYVPVTPSDLAPGDVGTFEATSPVAVPDPEFYWQPMVQCYASPGIVYATNGAADVPAALLPSAGR